VNGATRSDPAVLVNHSFANQRVTGQQRYAAEISTRLQSDSRFIPIGPGPFWTGTVRTWAWVQTALPWRAGRSVVLSMTARAPLWQRRQVLVVHDLFVLSNPEWFSRRYYLTHAPLLRAQIRGAAGVVAVSQPVADQLTHLYRGPMVVAPNAPSDVFRRADESETTLINLGLDRGSYILAVGSMDPRKNLARLAEAYGRLDDSERRAHPLVVVGGGSGIYRQQDFTWPVGTIDAGYVTDDELRQLYRGAGVVALASLAEGFGLPLVEAAAAGAGNLLVSDIPVFRWICGDAAHYIDPYSIESMTDGLRLAVHQGARGRIDLTRFDWDTSAQTVRELCVAVSGASQSAVVA